MSYDPRFYRGNPGLRSAYCKSDYTLEQIQEIKKCSEDIFYFLNNYCYITTADAEVVLFKPYKFQNKFIKTVEASRKVVLLSARQLGKTTSVAAYALWKILFTESYKILILSNDGAGAKDILDRIKTMYENIPHWLQQGVVECNKSTIELVNKSKVFCSSTTVNAGRGRAVAMVILDEFAAVSKNVADQFMVSVFPTLSSGKKTKIVILSTAKGFNHFHKIYDDATKKKNEFKPLKFDWRAVPTRDKAWEKSERLLLGDKFEEEHECIFQGASNTLLPASSIRKIDSSITNPICEMNDLKIFEEPIQDKSYIVVVDSAEGVEEDFSVCNVIKINESSYEQVAVYRNNTIKPELYALKVVEIAKKYNNGFVFVELNSIGSLVAHIIADEQYYENMFTTKREKNRQMLKIGRNSDRLPGIKTSTMVKNQGCTSIKNMIDNDTLIIRDRTCFEEFTNFVSKGSSYAAEKGYTDDIVMTFVLFGWIVLQPLFKEHRSDFVSGKSISGIGSDVILHNTILFGNRIPDNRWVDAEGNVWYDY